MQQPGDGPVEIARFSTRKLALSLLPGLTFAAAVIAFGVHTFGGYENQTFTVERVRLHSVVMIAGGLFVIMGCAAILASALARRGAAIYIDGPTINAFDQKFRAAELADVVAVECVGERFFGRPRHVRIDLRSGGALTPQVHFMHGTPEQIRDRLREVVTNGGGHRGD